MTVEHQGSGLTTPGLGSRLDASAVDPADLFKKHYAEADAKRKIEIEAAVKEADAVARKIADARKVIETPESVDFETLKLTHELLKQLKADFEAKRRAAEGKLIDVQDSDFRALISFHFSRIGGAPDPFAREDVPLPPAEDLLKSGLKAPSGGK